MSTSSYINHNGKLQSSENYHHTTQSRAFMYGDGLFETIRVINGQACFLEDHYKRLVKGCESLGIVLPSSWDLAWFSKQSKMLLSENGVDKGGRLRVHVSRSSGGLYSPLQNDADILFEVEAIEENFYQLKEKGVKVEIYSDEKKLPGTISRFKTKSALIYVLAQLFAQNKSVDEALIINDKGFVIESASSNIFLVSNGVLYTPSLKDGCVAGVMRKQVINMALEAGIKVYESALTPQNLLSADEIFLTNAMGVRWVSCFRSQRYYHRLSEKLVSMLNRKITSLVPDSQESSKVS
jgi:aminodeoxychorismate lyase